MADVTVYHNPNCGSSKTALALLDELGVDYEVVLYLKTPPDRATLEQIVAASTAPSRTSCARTTASRSWASIQRPTWAVPRR